MKYLQCLFILILSPCFYATSHCEFFENFLRIFANSRKNFRKFNAVRMHVLRSTNVRFKQHAVFLNLKSIV